MANEYLMALNGAFTLTAPLFPTMHSGGLWWSYVVGIHFGASLVNLVACLVLPHNSCPLFRHDGWGPSYKA